MKRLAPLVPARDALAIYLKAAGQDSQNKELQAQVDRLTKALPKAVAIAIYKKVGKTDSQNPGSAPRPCEAPRQEVARTDG